jgi:two-component system CheB/CheR fusion protein
LKTRLFSRAIYGKTIWEIGMFKDIKANRYVLELQNEKFIRYENLPIETATGKS